MVAIRYNDRNSFGIPHSKGELVLYPGVNLAIADDIAEEVLAHPVVKLLMERGIIEPLTKEPTTNLDIAGIPVVDSKVNDEPIPVMPVGDRTAAKNAPKRVKPKADDSEG